MKKIYRAAAVMGCLLALGMGSVLTEARGHWGRGHGYCGRGYSCGTQACSVGELEPDPEIMRAPAVRRMNGTIMSVEGDRAEVKDAEGRRVIALLDRDTYIVDGDKGSLRLPGALREGQRVNLYYSSRMTRSLPPQTLAYAFILGEGEDAPLFFPVAQARLADDGKSVRALNSNHDLIVAIDGEACPEYEHILPGDNLLVWSQMVTMSLPGQTHADKAVILP